MGRLTRGAPNSLLGLSLLACSCFGCGGGTTTIQQTPPPAQPDFTIGFGSNSINVHQGATSSAVNLSINPLNGFTGTVQVTLSGLPNGVNS
ncbi:MAG TPA: hypothetical protein VH114_04240, partial [Candidatus Acidoferrum sp.]|nr:hypothetical protein [Candidatus Acidoferrum sp.]